MNWEIRLTLWITAALMIGLAALAWRRRTASGAIYILILALAVGEWSFGYSQELGSSDLATEIFWAKMQYFGIALAPLAWLAFALSFTDQRDREGNPYLTPHRLAWLALVPVITLLLVWSNEWHGLIWSHIAQDTSTAFPLLNLSHGMWFWIYIAYSYLALALGAFLLVRMLMRSPHLYRGQAVTLLIGAVAPLLGNALYLSGLSQLPPFDFTPIAFAISSAALATGILRFRMLDIVPIARDAVIEYMGDGVLVLDAQNRVVDINPAAQRMTHRTAARSIGQSAASIFAGFPDLTGHNEITLTHGDVSQTLTLDISPLTDRRGKLSGRLVLLRDVTEQKHSEQALRENEKHRQELFATAQRQAQELALLNRVSAAIARQLDLPLLFRAIVEAVVQTFGYTQVSLYLLHGDTLELQDQIGYDHVINRIPISSGICGRVTRTGQAVLLEDAQADPTFLGAIRGILSEVCVPLFDQGRPVGVLNVESTRGVRLGEADLRLMTALSEQISVAIERARLYTEVREQVKHRASEFAALHELSNALSIQQDLPRILQTIVEQATALLSMAGGRMYLFDTAQGDLRPSAMIGTALEDEASQQLGAGLFAGVAQNRQPLMLVDYRRWEHRSPALSEIPITSVLAVPMLFGGELIGMLTVNEIAPETRTFTEGDMRLLTLFAEHAASAVYNARLFAQMGQRTKELEALVSISAALRTVEERNLILPTILDQVSTLLDAQGAAIAMRDSASGESVVELGHLEWADGTGLRLPAGAGVTGHVIATGDPYLNNNARDDQRQARADLLGAVNAMACVPMIARGKTIGALLMGRKTSLNGTDLKLLAAIADVAANAIHQASLHEQDQHRAHEFATLYETSRELTMSRDLPVLLQTIVDRVTMLLNAPSGGIYLYDAASNDVWLAYGKGHIPKIGTRLKMGEGMAGKVALTREPLVVEDYLTWEHQTTQYAGIPFRSVVEVPLLYGGELIGVLAASEIGDSKRKFTSTDARLLSLFASQAAAAVHNARLFAEIRRHLDELRALHAIDSAISSSLDLQVTLNVFLEQVTSHLGIHAVNILLLNPHTLTLQYGASRGFRSNPLPATQLQLGQGYAGQVALEHRTIEVRNLGLAAGELSQFSPEGFATYYGVPLIAKGQVKGVLEIFQRDTLEPSRDWLNLLETLANQAAIAIDNAELFKNLQRANMDLSLAYEATIEGWSHALDLRDQETEGHTLRVTALTDRLAQAMGISEEELAHIHRGALLHDIGKIGVPDGILLKTGPLTAIEWQFMRQHPVFAYELIAPITFLRPALDIPYCHHEKWDGTGYPRGLKGEEIPLAARIFAVADVWDALCSDRPYRLAWPKKKAWAYILEQAGEHFDPRVVETFLRLLEDGSIPKLADSSPASRRG